MMVVIIIHSTCFSLGDLLRSREGKIVFPFRPYIGNDEEGKRYTGRYFLSLMMIPQTTE